MNILLTGIAGFIGFHTAMELLSSYPSAQIIGLDNINAYYEPMLKRARLKALGIMEAVPGKLKKSYAFPNLVFLQADLCDRNAIMDLFAESCFDYVIHLAAQAGVRYSLSAPQVYVDSNITGFLNVLEGCRRFPAQHLIYASSSSVYGLNTQMPFSEADRVDAPASLYAATKKMNEAMAFTYAHLFGIKSSGLRFFTVYGEWGRPDMALFLFAERILAGKPIALYNHGAMKRDFTYISDIVQGVVNLMTRLPGNAPPAEIYNIGNNSPVTLHELVDTLEGALDRKAAVEYLPMQPGDVPATWANVVKLKEVSGFAPSTTLQDGVKRFVSWYTKEYMALKHNPQ